jgi:hypothetical protein
MIIYIYMPAESESGAPVERAAPTRVERTVSRIKEDFKNVELGSPRFQAFGLSNLKSGISKLGRGQAYGLCQLM